jgi:uncharacterized membrane protein
MANAVRAAIHPFPGENTAANAPRSGFLRRRLRASRREYRELQQIAAAPHRRAALDHIAVHDGNVKADVA